jgi:hypothetical protein
MTSGRGEHCDKQQNNHVVHWPIHRCTFPNKVWFDAANANSHERSRFRASANAAQRNAPILSPLTVRQPAVRAMRKPWEGAIVTR